MKIRTNFVSNSSSSSFIIVINKTDVCPHCGRGDDAENFIGLCRRAGDCDTEVEDIKDYLEEQERDLLEASSELAALAGKKDSDPAGYGGRYTVKDVRQWKELDISNYRRKINAIKEKMRLGRKVYHLTLDNHNDTLKYVLDSLVSSGEISILED